MKKLTLQDMTENQQQRVKMYVDQSRIKHGRPLTNSEQNRYKDEIINQISAEVEKEARKIRLEKKKQKLLPSQETYSWTATTHSRGRR